MNKKKSQSKKKQAMRKQAHSRKSPKEPKGPPPPQPSIFEGMTIEYKHGVYLDPFKMLKNTSVVTGNDAIHFDHLWLNEYQLSHVISIIENLIAELFDYSTELPDQIYLQCTEHWSDMRAGLTLQLDTLRDDAEKKVLENQCLNVIVTTRREELSNSYVMRGSPDNELEYKVAFSKKDVDSVVCMLLFENAVAYDITLLQLMVKAPLNSIPNPLLYSQWSL